MAGLLGALLVLLHAVKIMLTSQKQRPTRTARTTRV
jgi:hypothetical protein